MEGIIPASYNEILNLDKQGLNASLACPVGYRHPDDKYQYIKKVRKPKDKLSNTFKLYPSKSFEILNQVSLVTLFNTLIFPYIYK